MREHRLGIRIVVGHELTSPDVLHHTGKTDVRWADTLFGRKNKTNWNLFTKQPPKFGLHHFFHPNCLNRKSCASTQSTRKMCCFRDDFAKGFKKSKSNRPYAIKGLPSL
ncbi:MAG: hypothetical protein HY429_00460 [Candidatus Levybacteria bacterium]|nr:hypothetical protein [Candidatus Levybacteria bacterium]